MIPEIDVNILKVSVGTDRWIGREENRRCRGDVDAWDDGLELCLRGRSMSFASEKDEHIDG